MNSRNAMATICVALFVCLPGSAQNKKTENQTDLNSNTTRLIESLEGRPLYMAYCAACHGTDGKGIGPMTEWLKIKTPDLTRISLRGGGKFPLTRVQRIISGEEKITAGQDLGRMRVYNLAKFIEKMQQKQ